MKTTQIKICSVCKRKVYPNSPIQWWDRPYNSCLECVRKAAKEIAEGQKKDGGIVLTLEVRDKNTGALIIKEEHYTLEGLEEKLYRVERAIKEYEHLGVHSNLE